MKFTAYDGENKNTRDRNVTHQNNPSLERTLPGQAKVSRAMLNIAGMAGDASCATRDDDHAAAAS
ncbi:MAG: hypothetical protein ACO3F9_03380 [Burkholderiales bacterium]